MKDERKNTAYFFAVLGGSILILLFMIKNPDGVSNAARDGIDLCATTMIPTMFPFFVVTSFLMRSGAINYIGRKIDCFSQKLFKISGRAMSVFLVSLCSGFPVGAGLVSVMTEEKLITKQEGARLMTCCVNAGPAFVIGAVGSGMLKSNKAGVLLFASLTMSAILVFVLTGFLMKSDERMSTEEVKLLKSDFSASLVKSVADATGNMMSVCGWIIVFSCLRVVLKEEAGAAIMLFEVSLGCRMAVGYPLPVTALVIGWGGLCVHCQVFNAVIKSEIKKTQFFFFRMLNGALSAGICSLLLKIFPCEIQTFGSFSQTVDPKLSTNTAACAGLLMMCAILIVDFEESRGSKGQNLLKKQKSKNLKILRK